MTPSPTMETVRESPPVIRHGEVLERRCERCRYGSITYAPLPDPDDPNPMTYTLGPDHHVCRRPDGLFMVSWPQS